MKKIMLLMAIVCGMAFVSCTGCADKKVVGNDSITNDSILVDSTIVDSTSIVENAIAVDKLYMYLNYGKDYRWYETCIVMKDFLDEENDGTVTGISNIFQVVVDKGADVNVVMITHVGDSTQVDVKDGFWVEDFPMNDDAIKVSFKGAYDKVMSVNMPKPHSRHIVLRKQIGPNEINPQYIFGNTKAQIYVDATTGNITDKNPAFPTNLGTPLGEWP